MSCNNKLLLLQFLVTVSLQASENTKEALSSAVENRAMLAAIPIITAQQEFITKLNAVHAKQERKVILMNKFKAHARTVIKEKRAKIEHRRSIDALWDRALFRILLKARNNFRNRSNRFGAENIQRYRENQTLKKDNEKLEKELADSRAYSEGLKGIIRQQFGTMNVLMSDIDGATDFIKKDSQRLRAVTVIEGKA